MTTHFTWLQICQLLATTRHRTIDSKQIQGEWIKISDLQCFEVSGTNDQEGGRSPRPAFALLRCCVLLGGHHLDRNQNSEFSGGCTTFPVLPLGTELYISEQRAAHDAGPFLLLRLG